RLHQTQRTAAVALIAGISLEHPGGPRSERPVSKALDGPHLEEIAAQLVGDAGICKSLPVRNRGDLVEATCQPALELRTPQQADLPSETAIRGLGAEGDVLDRGDAHSARLR